jgi:hypothetical protein
MIGGPDTGFTAFVREAQDRLYRQPYLMSGDPQVAQDLVQATLVKLFLTWRRVANPYASVESPAMVAGRPNSRTATSRTLVGTNVDRCIWTTAERLPG